MQKSVRYAFACLMLSCFWMAGLAQAMTSDSTIIVIPSQFLATPKITPPKLDKTKWEEQFSEGLLQIMEGNYPAAETTYLNILQNTSVDTVKAQALLSLGELYQHYTDALERADQIYQELMEKYPNTKYGECGLFNRGLVNFHLRKYSEAYSYFTTYTTKYPDGRYWDNAKFMSLESGNRLGINTPNPSVTVVNKPGVMPQVEGYKVRIALMQRVRSVEITSRGDYSIWSGDDGQKLKTVRSGALTRFRLSGGQWEINSERAACNKILISSERGNPLTINDKTYRGQIQLVRDNGGFTAVNILSMEEYLYSVVPKEVSKEWPMEALKAQSVAARTYAMNRMNSRNNHDYDLVCTQMDQVYGGYESERERTTQAVDATRGEILVYDGEPIICYFHANSGGMTEDGYQAFGVRRAYLRATPDPYSKGTPGYRWSLRISAKELQKRLIAKGYGCGSISSVIISDKSPSGRVKEVKVFHSRGVTDIDGAAFRWKVDSTMMRSTLFSIRKEGNYFVFEGYGYGHGVGMSQWGCYNQARQGKDYRDILSYYYPGTNITLL
jgi:stage II sporulation protein D